jgi:hypothetical protein
MPSSKGDFHPAWYILESRNQFVTCGGRPNPRYKLSDYSSFVVSKSNVRRSSLYRKKGDIPIRDRLNIGNRGGRYFHLSIGLFKTDLLRMTWVQLDYLTRLREQLDSFIILRFAG